MTSLYPGHMSEDLWSKWRMGRPFGGSPRKSLDIANGKNQHSSFPFGRRIMVGPFTHCVKNQSKPLITTQPLLFPLCPLFLNLHPPWVPTHNPSSVTCLKPFLSPTMSSWVYNMQCVRWYWKIPEDDIGYPGLGVTGRCPNSVLVQILVFCKNSTFF